MTTTIPMADFVDELRTLVILVSVLAMTQ